MSNVLHDTPARKLHQSLSMIYPFYYISMLVSLFKAENLIKPKDCYILIASGRLYRLILSVELCTVHL